MNFIRWRDFNALRRTHVYFHVILEWLHRRVIPGEDNLLARIALGQLCVLGFLLRSAFSKTHISKIPRYESLGLGHGLALCEYELPTLRNKTVIRRALCLQSNITPRVISRSIARHGDDIFRAFNLIFFEMRTIVSTTVLFLQVECV